MKYVIARGTEKVDYQSKAFWQQFDEVEAEEPEGWCIRFTRGGMVHMFDYCQSTGRGDYFDQYVEEEFTQPLDFTADAKANAAIMHKTDYDNKKATLVHEKK